MSETIIVQVIEATESTTPQVVESVEQVIVQVVEGLSKAQADTLYAALGDVTMWNTDLQKWVRLSCVGNPPQLELEILN